MYRATPIDKSRLKNEKKKFRSHLKLQQHITDLISKNRSAQAELQRTVHGYLDALASVVFARTGLFGLFRKKYTLPPAQVLARSLFETFLVQNYLHPPGIEKSESVFRELIWMYCGRCENLRHLDKTDIFHLDQGTRELEELQAGQMLDRILNSSHYNALDNKQKAAIGDTTERVGYWNKFRPSVRGLATDAGIPDLFFFAFYPAASEYSHAAFPALENVERFERLEPYSVHLEGRLFFFVNMTLSLNLLHVHNRFAEAAALMEQKHMIEALREIETFALIKETIEHYTNKLSPEDQAEVRRLWGQMQNGLNRMSKKELRKQGLEPRR